MSQLLENWNGVPKGRDLGDINDLGLTKAWDGSTGKVKLLAPVDLQCVKACGVTFAVSAIERVIEERAKGVPGRAQEIREELAARDRHRHQVGGAGLGRSAEAEGGADRRRHVVAISGSGDRPGCGSLHQGAAAVVGGLGRL